MIIFVLVVFFLIWLIDYRKLDKGKHKLVFWVIFCTSFIPALLISIGVKMPAAGKFYEDIITTLHLNI